MLDVGPTMLLIISQNEEVSFHLLYWITNRDYWKILENPMDRSLADHSPWVRKESDTTE